MIIKIIFWIFLVFYICSSEIYKEFFLLSGDMDDDNISTYEHEQREKDINIYIYCTIGEIIMISIGIFIFFAL